MVRATAFDKFLPREACLPVGSSQKGLSMKVLTALFMGSSLFGLALPMAHAEEPLPPALPQGYDLMTLSRGPSKVTPGLESPRHMGDTATILSVVPASGVSAGTHIQWSGYVKAGIVFKNTRSK